MSKGNPCRGLSMKILLISGSHPRHLYVHQKILSCYKDCSAIVMKRESVLPEPPSNITETYSEYLQSTLKIGMRSNQGLMESRI